MTKRVSGLFVACLLLLLTPPAQAGDRLFQYSTIDALLAGLYDGDLSLGALTAKGGFGLGTVNTLDGELVVLDGVAYHVKAGGKARVAPGVTKTPFAVVTSFDEDSILKLDAVQTLDELNDIMLRGFPTRNVFYAIRVDGSFTMVKTRAIPGQQKPYKPLAELVKEQVIVKYTNVEGTLVGFWSPSFVKGINVTGFHWHFLTKDRTRGGHVLDCSFSRGLVARMDRLRRLTVQLPEDEAFDSLDLSPDRGEALHSVEKDPAGKQ